MYILEGNIGAGKSTFLKLIQKHVPYISVAQEPIHTWQQKVDGQSLLELFVQQPKRWAYTFEKTTMITRIQDHTAFQKRQEILLVERSVYSGHYCFARNSYEQGFMTHAEWTIYQEWFNLLVPQTCQSPSGFIYLRVSPDVAYKRMIKRNRQEEASVSKAYLQQLHMHHELFLINKHNILTSIQPVPVLVLDINEEFEENNFHMHRLAQKIDAFIRTTMNPNAQSHVQRIHSYEGLA